MAIAVTIPLAAFHLFHNPLPQAPPLQLPVGFAAALGAAFGAAGGGAGGAGGGAGIHPGQPPPHHANPQVSALYDLLLRNQHLFTVPKWAALFNVGQPQSSASLNTSHIREHS